MVTSTADIIERLVKHLFIVTPHRHGTIPASIYVTCLWLVRNVVVHPIFSETGSDLSSIFAPWQEALWLLSVHSSRRYGLKQEFSFIQKRKPFSDDVSSSITHTQKISCTCHCSELCLMNYPSRKTEKVIIC